MSEIQSFTPDDLDTINRFLSDPKFPVAFESWVKDWVASRHVGSPMNQLIGQPTYAWRAADQVDADETTASGSFVNLTTPGPTLDNLGNGSWLVGWGCGAFCSATESVAEMGLAVNNIISDSHVAGAVISPGATVEMGYWRHLGKQGAPSLRSTPNQLRAVYRRQSGAGNVFFRRRWLVAIRTGEVDE